MISITIYFILLALEGLMIGCFFPWYWTIVWIFLLVSKTYLQLDISRKAVKCL